MAPGPQFCLPYLVSFGYVSLYLDIADTPARDGPSGGPVPSHRSCYLDFLPALFTFFLCRSYCLFCATDVSWLWVNWFVSSLLVFSFVEPLVLLYVPCLVPPPVFHFLFLLCCAR